MATDRESKVRALAIFRPFFHRSTATAVVAAVARPRKEAGPTPQCWGMMRFVCLFLAHAVVVVVAGRGDGGTAIPDTRKCRARDAVSTWLNVPSSDSPHGALAPERSEAPAPAVRASSWWRSKLIQSNPHEARLDTLALRGGSVRSDERRASQEHQRVRNVLLYYPNLIGT